MEMKVDIIFKESFSTGQRLCPSRIREISTQSIFSKNDDFSTNFGKDSLKRGRYQISFPFQDMPGPPVKITAHKDGTAAPRFSRLNP